MKKSQKRVVCWVGIALLLILAGFMVKACSPRRIVEDVATTQMIRLEWNPILNSNKSRPMDLSNYDAERILNYLASCEEQRTLQYANRGFWMGDVKLLITLTTKDSLKVIHLGNDNYTYEGYKEPIYQIKDAERVLATLLTMLETDPTVDTNS